MEEIRYKMDNLSELEQLLIINALKIWRGDFGEPHNTQIWVRQLDSLLTKLGYGEVGWKSKDSL